MSRKIDPRAMRIGITLPWLSSWFADRDAYAKRVIEDDKIRKVLSKDLRTAGLEAVFIERSIRSLRITIRVARPGVVIGRKGAGLAGIREKLKHITKDDVDLYIEEVKKPETSAKVVAENIAMQVEKRVAPKRAINQAAEKAMDAGAKGVKIEISGTLHGPNSIAMELATSKGAVPTQTLRTNIDFAKAVSYTRGGTIGVRVWVNRGE